MTNRIIPTLRSVVLCLLLAAACSRYEWKPDYMVPEACPPAPRKVPGRRVYREVTLRGDSIRGRVSQAFDSVGIRQTLVSLGPGEAGKRLTNPLGRFAYGPLAPGLLPIRVRRIGYFRWQDTIRVVADERPDFEIRLAMEITDGPCSGFASVQVRKPWWKLW